MKGSVNMPWIVLIPVVLVSATLGFAAALFLARSVVRSRDAPDVPI